MTLFAFIEASVPSASTFDPVPIARTLQQLGDQYHAEMETKIQGILQEGNMVMHPPSL